MITGMPRIAIAVKNFSATLATFRDKLGMPVMDLSAQSVENLGAKLAMCVPEGGSNIEIMCPADPDAPLSQSLQSFLDRRGEGLFALMLEAPDPNAEAEELLQRGLKVLPVMRGTSGRDVHPKSTHGVLIRVYPVNSFQGQVPAIANDSSTPALSGITRVIIAVQDLDAAVAVYGEKFAMAMGQSLVDAERGVRSAICQPPSGGCIELVAVENAAQPFARSIAGFLESNREGMYALVIKSPNPHANAKALLRKGIKVNPSADSPDIVEIDRTSLFGTLIRIEPA